MTDAELEYMDQIGQHVPRPEDVRDLVAEVRRLRAENDRLRNGPRRLTDFSCQQLQAWLAEVENLLGPDCSTARTLRAALNPPADR